MQETISISKGGVVVAETQHKMVLSTTEPNNGINLVRIRQGDVLTQKFVVEVVEYGKLKTFDGLVPFFINTTKFGENQPVEQKVQEYSPAQARLVYTLSEPDWQWGGENTAHFSFRSLNGDGTWSEQFSTQDFTYRVISGITKSNIRDSAYVWTFEELLRMFQDGIRNSNDTMDQWLKEWDEFVNNNKEILESIDPGGELLNQINELKNQQKDLVGEVTMDGSLQIGGESPRPVFASSLAGIRNKIDKTNFNVLHMTDVHTDYGYNAGAYTVAQYFWSHITNIQTLQELADVAIYNGDNADCYLKDKEQSMIQQKKFAIKALRKASIPTFINVGNHDNGSPSWKRDFNGKVFPENIITNEEFKDFYSTKEKLFDEVREEDSLYFYKDFPDKKIRVVGINTNDNNQDVLNSDGSYKYGSHDHFAVQEKQLKWLADVALKIPADYQVLMFGHCPLQADIFDNRECIVNIIESFILGTNQPIKSVLADHEVDFTTSFSAQGPQTFIGYICGHYHDEGFNTFGNSVKFTQARCLNSCFNDETLINTENEDAWSVVSVDTDVKKVDLIGFGRATDRSFTY